MEKFIIKLLITILCVLIVFCMPVSADENDLEFQTSHLPVIEGFKVTADMPVSWEKGKVIAPKKEEFQFDYSFIYGEAPDEKYQVTRTWDCRHCPVSPRKDACDVCLGIILFEDPISFDKFAEGVKDHYNPKIYHTFDQGFNDKLGPKTFFQNVAYMKTSYGGKKVPPDSPDTTILKYLFQNRLLLSLSYRAIKPENYEQFLPVFEEIVKTVKVTKVNDSDIGINRYYFSPKVNIYAEEPNITLEGSFALVLPSGWTSKEVVTDSAALSLPSEWKSSNENGKLSIEFTPLAEGVEGESESKLIINIEGVEKQYYGDNFYFDVGDNYVSSIIPENTILDVQDATNNFILNATSYYDNCSYMSKDGTKQIRATTYGGKSPLDDNIKLRIYTSGGNRISCNYIYEAPAERFDDNINAVEEILGSLELNFNVVINHDQN